MPELVAPVVPAGRLRDQAQPRLTVDELVVRPWKLTDVERLVEAYRDPAIQRWHARSMTEDDASEWVTARSDRWAHETGADWAVVEDDVLLGRVGFRALDLNEGHGEAAYWVLPSARGRGIAVRALRAVTAWMFTHAGFHRLELRHSTRNEASCRVAHKAGYVFEGTMRRQTLHADGWHDMHLHARLQTDETRRPMPRVRLRDIVTLEDRAAVMGLSRAPGQDEYLNSMEEIFAEADEERRAMPKPWAVHDAETGAAVGFAMISDNIPQPMDEDLVGPYFLWKLLIDEPFQGRGYGGATVDAVVGYLATRPGADVLYTSCADGPGSPRGFYLHYGFTDTGRRMWGENVLALDLARSDTRVDHP
jgi:RimJ/RimL family protein N-acetyltransferase